ncbi:hypothetical protein H5410_064130, partial [Solanum commersonii]
MAKLIDGPPNQTLFILDTSCQAPLVRESISKTFWPEFVNWSTVHILKRSSIFSVKNMTPQEAWNERKPTVDYFRIFGCIAYDHVPDERRKKLDGMAENCVFLGLSESCKHLDRNRQQPTQILRDYDVEQEKLAAPCVLKNSSVSATTTSPTISLANEEATQTVVRVRRRPAWMKDYK